MEFFGPLKVSAFLWEVIRWQIGIVDQIQKSNSWTITQDLLCRHTEELVDHLLILAPLLLLFGIRLFCAILSWVAPRDFDISFSSRGPPICHLGLGHYGKDHVKNHEEDATYYKLALGGGRRYIYEEVLE